jgi:hypothetical protein
MAPLGKAELTAFRSGKMIAGKKFFRLPQSGARAVTACISVWLSVWEACGIREASRCWLSKSRFSNISMQAGWIENLGKTPSSSGWTGRP